MIHPSPIVGQKISLRMVEPSDCNSTYLGWLNNPEVNQYLETRWEEQTLEKINAFVQDVRESSHSILFAIVFEGRHVGNIKIGPIHPIYRYADISYFIGDTTAWGKGIATEAVRLVTHFGFTTLGLHRCQAGVLAPNVGSRKALERNGYRQEATYRQKTFIHRGDAYVDSYFYGILAHEWTP